MYFYSYIHKGLNPTFDILHIDRFASNVYLYYHNINEVFNYTTEDNLQIWLEQ